MLALLLPFLLPLVLAQSCANYGTALTPTTCACPPGFGGPQCTTIACQNPILPSSSRVAFSATAAGNNGAGGCGTQCDSGFGGGPTCNVCQSDDACRAATGATTLGSTSAATSGDIVCNKAPYTYTQGFLTCAVVNPTLQSVYPGTTTLTIQKTVEPSLSLSAPFGGNGTSQAQLLYSSNAGNKTMAEQFYCTADSCLQVNGTGTVDWTCQNLRCTCVPGTTFCGGSTLDLTNIIDGLSGSLEISCATAGSTCAFKQSVLNNLFGQSGLSLSSCQFGECARTSTIQRLQAASGPAAGPPAFALSGGVIAGLAVVGVIVALLIGLCGYGAVKQRKARKGGKVALNTGKGEMGGVGLRWKDLGYSLPSSSGRLFGMGGKHGVEDGRQILNDLTGSIAGGRLLAILGPTGAGKSTFVDLLAGKRKRGRRTGAVEIVLPQGAKARKCLVGYVDQHDVLPATSTVREALMFAAELKLGEDLSRAEKSDRVFQVLTQLGLVDVADSIIGSGVRRGISGGEKRRLSIGLELLAAPDILIADEPTSGLDSVSASRVVQVLKSLTNPISGQRTTVITTIHQPSSQIYHVFDQVLVLGVGGRMVYHGDASEASAHFAARGSPCPDGWNPADHLLEIASSPAPLAEIVSSQPPTDASAASTSSLERRPSLEKGPSSHTIEIEKGAEGRMRTMPITVLLTQFQVLSGREYRNLKRDKSLVVMHNAVAILVGLFVGGLYYQVNLTIGGFQSRIGSLFFLGSLLAFSSLSALSNFVQVKELFLRERAGGYYSPIAWFGARVVWDIIPLRIVPTVLVSCIVYWMVGLSPSAARFFKYILVLVEFNVATTLFNLFLAASIPDSGIAILISAVLNLFYMAFAGFFVNLASIPAVLRWLQWLSPLKYTLEALAVNEVDSGLLIVDVLQGINIQISAAVIMETLFGFDIGAYYRDVLVLFGFIGGFAILLVGTVWFKLKELR